jgi:hypothetical protein
MRTLSLCFLASAAGDMKNYAHARAMKVVKRDFIYYHDFASTEQEVTEPGLSA